MGLCSCLPPQTQCVGLKWRLESRRLLPARSTESARRTGRGRQRYVGVYILHSVHSIRSFRSIETLLPRAPSRSRSCPAGQPSAYSLSRSNFPTSTRRRPHHGTRRQLERRRPASALKAPTSIDRPTSRQVQSSGYSLRVRALWAASQVASERTLLPCVPSRVRPHRVPYRWCSASPGTVPGLRDR